MNIMDDPFHVAVNGPCGEDKDPSICIAAATMCNDMGNCHIDPSSKTNDFKTEQMSIFLRLSKNRCCKYTY